MPDSFTQTTRQSWLSRIAGSFVAMFVGCILALVAVVLLFWNEGREVKTAKSLKEGAAAVVSVPADAVDAANDLKLIHISGQATTSEMLRDPTFGVSANAIRLDRKVEIYEWTEEKSDETQKNTGGGTDTVTTYTYEKKWSPELIDSSHFKEASAHVNPTQMLAEPLIQTAKNVSLGAFALPDDVLSQMSEAEPLPVTADDLGQLSDDLKTKAQIENDGFYFGHDPHTPDIGDQRVTFTVLKPGPFSIVARQTGNTLESYPTPSGREIMLVEPGDISADLMFQHAESENQILAWILRGVGVFLLFIGLVMSFSPITTFADVIPFLGDILGLGTALAAALLTMAISLLTISIAWIAYRPLLGGLLLVAAVAGFVASKHLGSRAKASPAALPAG
jgi:hypothetical protein